MPGGGKSAVQSLMNIGKITVACVSGYMVYDWVKRTWFSNEEAPEGHGFSNEEEEVVSLNCPISGEKMQDPWMIPTCRCTFEKANIENHYDEGNHHCPRCNDAFEKKELIPNYALKDIIIETAVHEVEEITGGLIAKEE